MARVADEEGNASQSIEQYQQSYNLAKSGVLNSSSGTKDWIEYVRQASEAGYYLAWYRLDQQDREAANKVIDELSLWLAPFDIERPPGELRIALARLAWLKSRIASEAKDKIEQTYQDERVLELTSSFRNRVEDFGPLAKMRISALWSSGEAGAERTERRSEACALASEIEALVPGNMLWRMMACEHYAAQNHLWAGRYDDAQKAVDQVEQRLLEAEAKGYAAQSHKMLWVQTLSVAASIGAQTNDKEAAERSRLKAAEAMIATIKDTTYSQIRTDDVWEAYDVFRAIDFKGIPEFATEEAANLKAAQLFSDLTAAIEPSRKLFLKSRYYAAVTASASSIASDAYFKLARPQDALRAAQAGLLAVEDADLLTQVNDFNDFGAIVCEVNRRHVDALVALERTDDALSAFTQLQTDCGEWLRRYPWDFYARTHTLGPARKVGQLLLKNQRFGEAEPLLRYASNWGQRDATLALAELFRARSDSPEASATADQLEKFAAGQSMKRFTVPADFSGIKHPFFVYVSEYAPGQFCPIDRALLPEDENCVGFRGIDDQVEWLKQARGGELPADVPSSFQKLNDIALENGVSFPDLAVYALTAATEVQVNSSQAEAIYSEMKLADFWRNPFRALDKAGVALGGYDAVSYVQNGAPALGLADHFVLWDGALWFFSSADNRIEFQRRPEFYAPMFGGFASTEMARGERSFPTPTQFLRKDDKLYLFHSQQEREEWAANTEKLAEAAQLSWLYAQEVSLEGTDSKVAEAVLGIGPVRVPHDYELVQYKVVRSSQRIEKIQQYGLPDSLLVSALGSRSWSHALLGQPMKALEDAERALSIDSNQAWIVGNKANALLILGRVDEAVQLYRTIDDQPGPDEVKPMCFFIRDDLRILQQLGIVPEATVNRTLEDIPCTGSTP